MYNYIVPDLINLMIWFSSAAHIKKVTGDTAERIQIEPITALLLEPSQPHNPTPRRADSTDV